MAGFVHLRTHSRFSIGSGTLKIKEIPKLCEKNGMSACALTDTNLMSGTAEFSDLMPKDKIQPIIGIEISLNHHSADPKILRESSLSKIVLLVQNHAGYLNLCELNKIMYMRLDNHHLGPYITFDELENYNEGLICLSGAHTGPLGMSVLNGQDDLVKIQAKRFHKIFGDRFYIEIQRHGFESEIKTEKMFLDIAQDLNIPIVATNDVCFASPENYEAEDALACVLSQTKVIDPDRPRKSSEQYFKSIEEMTDLFSDLPEAIENTVVISKRCAFMVNVHEKPLLPRFAESIEQESKILRNDTMSGLAKRLEQEGITDTKPYYDQAEFEIQTIINMGFPGYFLIVADYIEWCRKNDILVGPGRGSGAGSIVAWSLGITNVNPLKYGLLFERFLNPDRISMPDFDVDFEPIGIERVLNYIGEKYGRDSVCRIITFGSLQARGAVRDIGRVYGIPYSKSDRLSKLIPNDAKTLKAAVEDSSEIQEILCNDDDMKKVIDVAQELEGSLRNLGQHACGVVIGDRPTTCVAPVYRDPSNALPSSQFDGHYLEATGLIKFDFLGLETLSVLKYATKLIRQTRGINIDLDKIPTDDPKTMKLWKAGLTEGIFQFDAPFVQQTLRKMKPNSFLEISALNALNRPGPIAFIPQFIARMHGDEKIEYVHPQAEPVLKETYGIIVYQEQVMQLTRTLAGFTRGESDNVRKAMGKKIAKMMDELEIKFLDGCEREKTLDKATAKNLWEKFKEFAKYAFNKSHAIAYSIVANQCAYIKANYPPEFLAASMSSNLNDSDQMALFFDDAKSNFNITVVPPNINESESLFTVRDGKIIYGLAALKGVGTTATDLIIAERNAHGKFKNLTDFAKRCAGVMNKRILEAFIKVGVLDSLEPNRAKLFMNADTILSYASKSKEFSNSLSLFANTVEDDISENRLHKNLSKTSAWSFGEILANELSAIGFYISAHPLDQYKNLISRAKLTTSNTLSQKGDRMPVQIAVNVSSYSRRRTKAGKDMITINASDSFGNIDAVAFGDSAAEFAQILSGENVVILSGKVSNRDDRVSIFVDSIIPLNFWVAKIAKKIILDIKNQSVLADIKKVFDNLIPGHTKIILNLYTGDKVAKMVLPKMVELSESTASDLAGFGIKVEIE
ncbi:MAG: DNA polymerase III subunit alpha [Alphaproteobacteria bacterium]|nr:DNA polymerase III subunit alpha [Alphaproteobacteria bacterium]MBN2675253.1 DNA polymerase III subunit alpha [Alphaproteobacteria bacterium]